MYARKIMQNTQCTVLIMNELYPGLFENFIVLKIEYKWEKMPKTNKGPVSLFESVEDIRCIQIIFSLNVINCFL